MDNKIIELRQAGVPADAEAAAEIRRLGEMLSAMAAMLKATTESMAELRRQVALLEKVTPAQASAVNRAIRERAAEICGVYGIRGAAGEKAAASAIRKAIRLQFGAASAREIPRCEYGVAMDAAGKWDDYREMMKIKKRGQS